MAKKVKTIVKLQVEGGRATPAPPVGTALGPHGINLQQFVLQFNEATKDKVGQVTPVEITVYEDRSFEFKLKTPPAAYLLRVAAGLEKVQKTATNRRIVNPAMKTQFERFGGSLCSSARSSQ